MVGVPALVVVLRRALLADLLAELPRPQELDEPRPEEDRDQHRRHPGDQDLAAIDRPTRRPRWRARRAQGVIARRLPRRAISSSVTQLEADGARALDQQRVARLEHRLGERHRRLGIGRPGVGGVVAGELADPDQRADAELARMRPDLAVIAGRARAQLRHLAEHGDVAAGRRERGQVIERRAHRDRVGVVAVVHDDDSVGQLDQLAAQAREGYLRRPPRHLVQRDLERLADRDRRQGVGQVVRLAEREREALLAGGRPDRWPRWSARRRSSRSAKTSPPAPKVIVTSRSCRCGSSASASAGTTARSRSPSPARISAFASAIASRVPSSSRWTGPMLVIAATSGSAISQSSAIWPAAAHRHLEHQRLRLGRSAEHGERQADLGVVVLRAGVDAQGQDRVADVLDRRLAHRPGDPDHRASELAPPGASERLERRRADRARPAPSRPPRPPAARRRRAPASARAPARPRRPRPRPRAPRAANSPPSARSPRRPKNRSPGRDLARVDHRALRAARPRRRAPPRLRPRRRSGLGTSSITRATLAARASLRSSSSATSRSSNGIFRPPANSCPCSWPLPAITTVSPGRRGLERERDRGPAVGLDLDLRRPRSSGIPARISAMIASAPRSAGCPR